MDRNTALGHIGLSSDSELNRFIDKVILLYSQVEGGYDAVNASDGNAMSIGILQWHGDRAQLLLQKLLSGNEEKAILAGTQIYEDVCKTAEFWQHRIAYRHEVPILKTVLSSPTGRNVQDAVARKDISTYLLHGIELGITDLNALAYFCDLENQGGEYVATDIVQGIAQNTPLTLLNLCVSALKHPLMGVTRRRRRLYSYQKISAFFSDDP